MSILVFSVPLSCRSLFFFFNDTATPEIYTLSLHDALPISTSLGEHELLAAARARRDGYEPLGPPAREGRHPAAHEPDPDRKSTRLNSSHSSISYAVFCLKKKKKRTTSKRQSCLLP